MKIRANSNSLINYFELVLFQAILNTHPYHVDSLLQLSEICKMGEDYQMAAELVGQYLRTTTDKLIYLKIYCCKFT